MTKTAITPTFGFFSQKDENITFTFHNTSFLNFLSNLLYIKKAKLNNEFILVQQRGNLIKKIQIIELLDIFSEFLQDSEFVYDKNPKVNAKEVIINSFNDNYKKFNDRAFYNTLPTLDIKTINDTSTESFTFYKNGVVTVTKDSISFTKYENSFIDGYVWADDILDRNFYITEETSVTEKFAKNICKKKDITLSEANYKNLMWATGYLLHNYAGEHAIILTDEKMGETLQEANGRCGKSIWRKVLNTIKTVSLVDGKGFTADNSFKWQTVSETSKIVSIDDVKPSFKFDDVFAVISDGFEVNKKYCKPFFLNGLNRPKVIIGTNYSISGVGSSYTARQFLIELGSHYNENFTPFMEFGHYLIQDWNDVEFIKNDNFLFKCIQFYLSNKSKPKQLAMNDEVKKLQVRLGTGFMDFYQEENVARLVYLSNIDHGVYLMNEFTYALNNKLIDAGCPFMAFTKKINEIMKYYKIDVKDPIRKKHGGVTIRASLFETTSTTPVEIMKQIDKLNGVDSQTLIKEYKAMEGSDPTTTIPGWDL